MRRWSKIPFAQRFGAFNLKKRKNKSKCKWIFVLSVWWHILHYSVKCDWPNINENQDKNFLFDFWKSSIYEKNPNFLKASKIDPIPQIQKNKHPWITPDLPNYHR